MASSPAFRKLPTGPQPAVISGGGWIALYAAIMLSNPSRLKKSGFLRRPANTFIFPSVETIPASVFASPRATSSAPNQQVVSCGAAAPWKVQMRFFGVSCDPNVALAVV